METRPFFTRRPELAFLRQLVSEQARGTYEAADLKGLFRAVDALCRESFPKEEHGGWFSPLVYGGAPLNHTPPHILSAVYAIYADRARGERAPVPFLAGPLVHGGSTALQLDPSEGFTVMDCDREVVPLTDLLILHPSLAPAQWILDAYGCPALRPEVEVVGWHAAGISRFTAHASGLLLVHPEVPEALDPLADVGVDLAARFFSEPILASRVQRHCERFAESTGTPLEVLQANYASVKRVIDAYLSRFGPLRT